MASLRVPSGQRLNALDTLVPPAYIRFPILFKTRDITSSLARLEAGARRLVSEAPFLAGFVVTGPYPELVCTPDLRIQR